jgi:pSer/pThr/pTyr-binding forkhead associated (FHA) protein
MNQPDHKRNTLDTLKGAKLRADFPPLLMVHTDSGRAFPLSLEGITPRVAFHLGRRKYESVDLRDALNLPTVSKDHCTFTTRDGKVFITDCKSLNGTTVNGENLEPYTPRELKNGDVIQLAGCVTVTFLAPNTNLNRSTP